ncbi:MAG: hypothetical protein R3Y64_01615 [Peptostreptococcaceae bacterium]
MTTIEFLDEQIEIPNSLEKYNNLRRKYQIRAKNIQKEFIRDFEENKFYLDTSILILKNEIKYIVKNEIKYLLEELSKIGFSEVDTLYFQKLYYDNHFEINYFLIDLEEEFISMNDNYECINFKKVKILKDIKEDLGRKLYHSIFNIHYTLIRFLRENNDFSINIVSDENVIYSLLTFEDAKRAKNPQVKKEKLQKSIILNPYNKEIYRYILKEYKMYFYSVFELASYFGIDF